MTEGEYLAFIAYNGMLTWPVRMLGRMIAEMSKAGVSVDRIMDILCTEMETDSSDAMDAPMDGDLVFDHVSFAYEGGEEILQNVSFTVRKGKSVLYG